MEIILVVFGKTHASWLKEGEAEFKKRISRYAKFSIQELKEVKNKNGAEATKIEEGVLLKGITKPGDVIILLDEGGKEMTSVQMSKNLQKKFNQSPKRLLFVIGGPYGFSPDTYAMANDKWSLSKLTFSHQMVRTFFLEQLYRSFTILKNEPYHHQ